MSDLFFRTASEALQAFLPVAFGLAVLRRTSRARECDAVLRGLYAAVFMTVPAGWLFQQTTRQALSEATLAALALGSAAWLIRQSRRSRAVHLLLLSAVTTLTVTRQTMEIEAVFSVAAFQIRSFDAVLAVCSATALATGIAAACLWSATRSSARTFSTAVRVFSTLFVCQLAMYVLHESAEARLLPWSETLHAATEPYGPDGVYGQQFSWLLIGLPAGAAIAAASWRRWKVVAGRPIRASRYAFAAGLALIALGDGVSLRSAVVAPAAQAKDIAAMAGAPHLLFRHTDVDNAYNTLSIAPLANPSSRRLSVGLPCERVAFNGNRGICLQAARGVFTTYRAVVFDQQFKTITSFPLDGSPSRARVAPDARVGAVTVFVTGHGYGTSTFSTKTTLVDMASGDVLGDLEQFTTWRDGARVKAQDFNFWGVTFGRNSNNFYATLGTAGKTYLVKGDLGLRKLTVLHEGVECPSLSPDERLIAFKKRTSETAVRWRLAILDVATMAERLVAGETRNIDDQVEWLNSGSLLYAVPREGSAVTDVWVAQVAADVPPRIFISAAESPIVVR